MKGFLVFLVVLIGGTFYFFRNTDTVADKLAADLRTREGASSEAFKTLSYSDGPAFKLKYGVFLDERAKVAKWMGWLGENQRMVAFCAETQEIYDETPLNEHPSYGDVLYRRGMAQEDTVPMEAFEVLKHFVELFPQGEQASEAKRAIERMIIKHNYR